MKKILTVSIAAYNVQKYIENTINSLLVDNIEDLEILVEDDGGTDNTANIVKKYEEKYPGIIKLVHKENGGYGSTINKSIELAQGKYFKQLDGDDWYEHENFEKFLELLRKTDADVVYTPFLKFFENDNQYEQIDFFDKKIDKIHNLSDIILKANHHLNMYTLCYKTEILKSNHIKLLEHCFYTDTQYAMYPITMAKTINITHIPIYIYRIGREEQSMSLSGHIKHYKDHVRVSKDIIDFYNNKKFSENIKKYISNYAVKHITTTISEFYMVLDNTKNNLEEIKKFEKYILENSKEIYNRIEEKSKIIKILRKTNYNYILYSIMTKLKRKKVKKGYK